jgi:ATP-binding cassette subfamily F protein uup
VIYLSLDHVNKSYGEKLLFSDLNLQISKGQKIALVAKNGSGKSTLMRIITGEEAPEGEKSEVFLHKEITIGFLPQNPQFDSHHTILDAVLDSSNPIITAIRDYEYALLIPPQSDEKFQKIMMAMDDHKAWELESKIMEVLSKLKLSPLDKPVAQLSGGQIKRLALAKLLIEEPGFMILDEPTNHLDLDMVEWLEQYLSQPNLTLFMVTHDRYFLERVCNHIIELDEGNLYRYSGNYGQYLEKKAIRKENEAIALEKNRKLYKKELEWVRRMPKARGTKDKSRIQAFEAVKDKISDISKDDSIQLQWKGERMGKKILELHQISKKFDEHIILNPFSYKFSKGERVGIIGPNGAGKSTFLQLITEELPSDTGKITKGDNTLIGYYRQDGILLNQDKRVIEVIQDIAEYIPLEKGNKLTAAQLLERFLFSRKQQQVYVSQLSGGEKRRLFLLTILMHNPNFLILDEPTNDLDILTLNVLEEFLQEFPGCIVIVSHDRYFMDKLVDHLFVLNGKGAIEDFNGNYSEYRLHQKEVETTKEKILNSKKGKSKPEKQPKDQKEIKRLEKQIANLEEEKTSILKEFETGINDQNEINQLSEKLAQINEALEEKEMKWFELAGE